MKKILERLCKGKVHRAFDLWKIGKNYTVKTNLKFNIHGLNQEGIQLTNDVAFRTKELDFEKDR